MWRLSHRVFGAVSGLSFWVQRRFTAAGLLALGALVTSGALGIDTNQTLAYQIFTFVLALLALAVFASALARQRFKVERALPRVITAGEEFDYRVRVTNLGRRATDGLALIEDLGDPRPNYAQFRAALKFPTYRGWWRLTTRNQVAHVHETVLPALAPGAATDVRVRGRAYRRGILSFAGSSIARADPLGLARTLTRVAGPDKLIVLPHRYQLPPLPMPGQRRYQHGGVTLASSVGDSEEFMGLRDYRPGDPLQRIHWKSYARSGKPVVKEYQDEFFERHALVLDTFAAAEHAAFEEAVSLAASFACTLDTQECLLDLMFVEAESYCYTAGRGQLQPWSLAEILAGVRAVENGAFRRLHDAVVARRAALSGCILILIDWDAARRELVNDLRRSGLPLRVLLVCERDLAEVPAWVCRLTPGKIQEGLAKL